MFAGNGGGDALDIFFASFRIAAAILLEQYIHDHQPGHLGGDRAKLEGAFVGAAAQDYIRQPGSGGFVERVKAVVCLMCSFLLTLRLQPNLASQVIVHGFIHRLL